MNLSFSSREPVTGVYPPSGFAEVVQQRLRSWILSPRFSCLGAKAALRRGTHGIGIYGPLGSADATAALASDLRAFGEWARSEEGLSTFVASFLGPAPEDELAFEALLWAQLQDLHDEHDDSTAWDPSVSPNPEDPYFGFSFGANSFFVVGLHPESSRTTRQFEWPTLVFNPREQFDRLRERGQYGRFASVIRKREMALQGSLNPNLADWGTRSEARQYSGRAVEEDWVCPFHASGR